MNEKQQQLTFDKGITNVPSDALCSDNALEESLGMVYDDGEHRVIQKPVTFMTGAPKILFVHKVHGNVIYIALRGSNVVWGTNNNGMWADGAIAPLLSGVTESNLQVTSIGKTLIIKSSNTINYFLWNADLNQGSGGYTPLGNKLPEIDIRFGMHGSSSAPISGAEEPNGDSMNFIDGYPYVINQKLYDDQVIGLYNKNIKDLYKSGKFPKPFVLRYALELYDGTYAHASAPIMMFPSVTENSYGEYKAGFSTDSLNIIKIYTDGSYLKYKRMDTVDLSLWSDIVKEIVVFMSDDVEIYELLDEVRPRTGFYDTLWKDGVIGGAGDSVMEYKEQWKISAWTATNTFYFLPFQKRSPIDIMSDLKKQSIFYRIFSIGTPVTGMWQEASFQIQKHTLENLTTQEQLEDDYYSHCIFSGENISSYNNRLLLADATRSYFEGFLHFLPYDGSLRSWTIEVDIYTPSGIKTVRKNISSTEYFGGWYFFYPDPRARTARIYDGNDHVKTLALDEHPGLNGAVWMAQILPTSAPTYSDSGIPVPPDNQYVYPSPERLYNEIFASEVNNPFVFRAEGNIAIGNGEIIGISTLTQAISQGQFGQYPLIIFTTEGIWAASTGATGLFTAVHPMSREICNSPKSITQTDGAVFFSSEKGLMLVYGSPVMVKCVSEQLSGKNGSFEIGGVEQLTDMGSFVDFLKSAVIAYDYRDSLLWIMKPNEANAWVYSIKSGTFAHYRMATLIPQANVQQSPQLRMAPRRSASESATNPYAGWPELEFANIDENAGSSQGTVVDPIGVVYAEGFDKFCLKGYNSSSAITYQMSNWVYGGHADTDYNNGNKADTATIFKNTGNGRYYIFIADEGGNLINMGTTDPRTWYLSVDESSLNFAGAGAGKQIVITSNISWEIITSQVWVTASPASGSGNATVTVTANQNQTTIARNATLTVRGTGVYAGVELIINISQDAGQVTPQLTVSKQTVGFGSSADSDSFNITSNTSWTISENSGGWLTVNNGTLSGSGNATIPIAVTASPTAYNRQATITITDGTLTRTIVVAQSGSGSYSSLSFSPYAPSFTASGGEIDATLTCDFTWNMVGNSDWITISPSSGSGSGIIRITADRNRTANARTATLELVGGGQAMTITVSQEAGTAPVLSVDQNSLAFNTEGGSPTFNVTSDVDWTAALGDGSSWITSVSPNSHTNSGSQDVTTVTVVAPANTGENQRTGTLIISDGYGTEVVVSLSQSGNNPEPPIPTEYSVNVVNDYPDSLIQVDSKVYSLMERVNINNDNGTYSGTIITRPMKLENALALKSIMQIRHILQMDGTITMQIFASNNLDNWVELHSLRGTPWKYYKFRFNFSDMKATDRFAGTMLITQERRTNKMR